MGDQLHTMIDKNIEEAGNGRDNISQSCYASRTEIYYL
jgi:hypothetical protein